MQKRSIMTKSGQDVPLTFYEVKFNDSEPIKGIMFTQTDDPIRYLHAHNSFEIGYCHQGSGIFAIENKLFSYRAGSVCIVTSREFHLAQSTPGTGSVWTFLYIDLPKLLRPGTAEELEISDCSTLSGHDFNNLLTLEDYPVISELGRILSKEFSGKKAGWLTAVRGIMWALLCEMHRLVPVSSGGESESSGIRLIAPALDRIAKEYRTPLDIQALAGLCNMSAPTFRRYFNAEVGSSPLHYLHTVRIRMASIMLKDSGDPVSSIAAAVGYSTLSSFNRQFLKIQGMSPRNFRAGEKAQSE